jgi:myo-inositol-1(or 4)-monophosphatase
MTGVEIADIKQVIEEAGQLALLYYGKVSRSIKADLSVVSEADAAVESFLRLSLTALAPGYGYVGEETEDSRPPAPGETHAWVVDALDGSRAFVAELPLWVPAVCLMNGDRPVAGAAINPVTRELFWADEEGPAFCNDEPLQPTRSATLEPNTFILGPTNYHRTFAVDFPGRIYCLGAPIYQLCLVAKGAVSGLFFDPAVNLWDLALPSLLLERTGAVLVYASGRPVDLSELAGRSQAPEPIYAGSPEMVEILRERITYKRRGGRA